MSQAKYNILLFIFMETIGSRLKYYAKERYGGVSKLAEALGITQPRLSQYISNTRNIDIEVLQKLIGLGCDIQWLLTGQSTPNFGNITECDKLRKENAALRSKIEELSDLFLKKLKEIKRSFKLK